MDGPTFGCTDWQITLLWKYSSAKIDLEVKKIDYN